MTDKPEPSPIQLTDEQKQERLQKKVATFKEGLEKLQKDTGLTMIPIMDYQPTGIKPNYTLVETLHDTGNT